MVVALRSAALITLVAMTGSPEWHAARNGYIRDVELSDGARRSWNDGETGNDSSEQSRVLPGDHRAEKTPDDLCSGARPPFHTNPQGAC